MPFSSALSAAGLSFIDLRQIIKIDIEASNELQARIDQLRHNFDNGIRPPDGQVEALEKANKDMTKDLVHRIEKIENAGPLTPADREMLQALNARLTICDQQGMQLTDLRELEAHFDLREAEKIRRESMYQDPLPLGGAPRKPSMANTVQLPVESSGFPPPPPPPANIPPYIPSRQPHVSFTSPFTTRPTSNSPRSSGVRLNELNNNPSYSSSSLPTVGPTYGDLRRNTSSFDRVQYLPSSTPIFEDLRRSNPSLDRVESRSAQYSPSHAPIYEDLRRSNPNLDRSVPSWSESVPVYATDPRRSNPSLEAKNAAPPSPTIYGDPRRSNPSLDRVDSKYVTPSPPTASSGYGSDLRRSNPNLDRSYVPPSPPIGPRSASSARSDPASPAVPAAMNTQYRTPSVETVDSKWTPPSPGPKATSSASPRVETKYIPTPPSSTRDNTYIHPFSSTTRVESPYFPPPPTADIREVEPDITPRRASTFPNQPAPDYRPPAEHQPSRRGSTRSGTGEYQFYSYADYSSDEEDDDSAFVAEWEKTRWPLAYRVLNIDPSLDPRSVQEEAMNALERLSLKHDPARFPNDPDAPARWAAINKAFDVLVHPVRKQNYDIHGNEPQELKEIDVEELKIIDEMR